MIHFMRTSSIAPGKVGEPMVFADLPAKEAGTPQIDNQPDGMCLDAAGNLYVAHYGMKQVQVLDPTGKLIRRYEGGNITTSNVAFSGPNMDQLFITGGIGPEAGEGGLFRIDLGKDGRIEIYDFKTGAPPSARQVLSGLAPQLALEAGMARAGAFGEAFAGRPVSELAWLALGQAERGEPLRPAVEKDWTADRLGEEALARLGALVAAYDREGRGYVSRARPMFEMRFESPYDHLARVREWLIETGSVP